jgi:subtilisin family serine protease
MSSSFSATLLQSRTFSYRFNASGLGSALDAQPSETKSLTPTPGLPRSLSRSSSSVGGSGVPAFMTRILSAYSRAALPNPTTLPAGNALNGALQRTDALNPNRRNRYADDYRLTNVNAGDRIRINLTSNRFDTFLQIIDGTSGKVLRSNDDVSATNTNSRINLTVQDGVDYRIRVTSYGAFETGAYRLNTRTVSTSSNPGSISSFNFSYGYGLIDAAAAVGAAVGRDLLGTAPPLGGTQWGLDMINAPAVWNQGYTGQGIVVAVLDTGVNYNHSDLRGNIWRNPGEIAGNGIDDDGNGFVDDVRGWKFVDGSTNNPMDRDGHGTHVAGIIAGMNNGVGVTGVAYDAKIMPVRVIDGRDDNSPRRFDRNVANGIRYAVDNGAHVLNLSLGNYLGDPDMTRTRTALAYARDAGVVVVMASGNERQDGARQPIQPAIFAREGLGIAVGAVNSSRRVANFSNPAGNTPMPFVVAPGVNIRSTVLRDRFDSFSGTSMAAPFVAGVAALMLSANPNLSPAQVAEILRATAVTQGVQA